MVKGRKIAFYLLIVLAVSTSFGIYSFQSQKRALEVLRDEKYVTKKIREELGGEFEFIILYRPINIREEKNTWRWVKRHSTSNFVRFFYAYLKDPETTDLSENEFFLWLY